MSVYLDKVVEVYKARMTMLIALSIALVTVTGYGFNSGERGAFLVAAAIPALMLLADTLIKGAVLSPFLYKALMESVGESDPEPVAVLLLDFRAGAESNYVQIRNEQEPRRRRAMFLNRFIRRGLALKLVALGSTSIVELLFYFF